MRPYLERAEREGRFGVVAIVAAQEFQWVFGARNRSEKPGVANFEFTKAELRISVYYFYVYDPSTSPTRDFGPGFIKICSYFPYPAKVWLNGHEWAKRQAERTGVDFTALSNGFASCAQPRRLQALCDRLGPRDVQAFFDRWTAVTPTPFTAADRAAGYWWELSLRQVEVSRTLVFDDPRRARRSFEALVADNIDIGRPKRSRSCSPARCARRPASHSGVASLLHAVTGFSNKSLRGHVAGLLGQEYTSSQMSYDLRRLRLHGLIRRLPHSNTYVLTGEGIRVAVFYTKLQNRLLRPLLAADKPPARPEIRRGLDTLEHAVNQYTLNARLAVAAA